MQSLALPRPTSHLTTPFGHPQEVEDGLAKLRSKLSSGRTEQLSYPSPPMSEPHSPNRRLAHTSEPLHHSYPTHTTLPQRVEAGLPLPPPSSVLFDPRPTLGVQTHPQERALYPGESHLRGQSLHYQSGRPIEHSPYSGHPAPQSYAYEYQPSGVHQYASSHHAGPMGQQSAIIAPPPMRPSKPARRTKAHVASACVNCKKAHLSCDVQRPCGRCVASGKQDTCKDVQHKKRGRPRLRDDREFSRPEEGRQQPGHILGGVPAPVPETYPHSFQTLHSHRVSDPPKYSGRRGEEHSPKVHAHAQSVPSTNGIQPVSFGGVAASPYAAGPTLAYQTLPVAFLNLDLVVQKSNQAFQDLVSFLGDVRGKHLGSLLEARQNESLQRLRNELRDERDEREPTYMAPITPVGQDPMRPVMESLVDRDVEHVSHGFTDRPMYLSFRTLNGQFQSLQVQIRLAKTSLYFVTLVVRSLPHVPTPALLTQQLASPTLNQSTQSMSAPTTAPTRDYTSYQGRPPSSTSSASSSPYINISSIRTSLPAFSPGSYGSSPSYTYSPSTGAESGYFPNLQPPSQTGTTYPSPYAVPPRKPSVTSEPLRDPNRTARLEGLQLPPIRTGPAPLGSPLHLEGQSAIEREREFVRRRVSSPSADERRPETPETGKRRRLNIREVLG
ncbi:hypothetical protein BKA63DRAFT_242366 [Paraphoma chrysanthemicola]|nr:hypothetical protein BKA63DRAFT_242366 [Paraphoma chrysanthemicola]